MNPFLSPSSPTFADEVTDSAVLVMAGAGMQRLSIGVVAAGMRMTRQGLTHLLKEGIEDDRSESPPTVYLHAMIVGRFGARFVAWSTRELFAGAQGGLPRLALPTTPDERSGVRIWLALRELARADWVDGHPDTGRTLADVNATLHNRVRRALEHWAGRQVPSLTVRAVLALTDGLQIAVADPAAPLSPVIARTILDREVANLTGVAPRHHPAA